MSAEPVDLLRQHGVQVTAQRLAVLRAVSATPHITADAVAEVARGEIGAISRQSVYDALGVLVERGLIRRIQPVGSAARYEDRVGDNHHHLICRVCGRLVDVDCAVGAAPCLDAVDDQGFEIDEADLVTVRPRSVQVALSPTITIPEWAEEQARAHARSLGWDYYVMRSNWLAFAHDAAAKGNPPKNAGAAFVAYCKKQENLRG